MIIGQSRTIVGTVTNFADIEEFLSSSPLDNRLGIEYLEVSPDKVVARMPVEGNTQPLGMLHGGASCVLAESAGSVAAALHGAPDRIAVGIDINATHHRQVKAGYVTAVATPAHRGRQTASYEVVISDDEGRRVCSARITCHLSPAPGSDGGHR
jgi:uncharacterized protein (TIGR00369 family)